MISKGVFTMEKQIYRFNNDIETLEVGSIGAKIIVRTHEKDEFYAEYSNPKDTPEFCAVLSGTTLTFKEKMALTIFAPKPSEDYTITVYAPQKKLGKLRINTASGGVDIAEVTANEFDLNTASGNININAFFDNVKLQSASGNITLTNPTTETAVNVKVCSVSGTATINGYKAQEFSLHSVSGKTEFNGASGCGKIAVTSGNIFINYAEWNNDLSISAISGNVNVTLPENAGVEVNFEGVSGNLKTDLGATKGQFMNLGKGTTGKFGGETSHKLNISLTSGNVTVAQQ